MPAPSIDESLPRLRLRFTSNTKSLPRVRRHPRGSEGVKRLARYSYASGKASSKKGWPDIDIENRPDVDMHFAGWRYIKGGLLGWYVRIVEIPYWSLCILSAIPPMLCLRAWHRHRSTRRVGRCPK